MGIHFLTGAQRAEMAHVRAWIAVFSTWQARWWPVMQTWEATTDAYRARFKQRWRQAPADVEPQTHVDLSRSRRRVRKGMS